MSGSESISFDQDAFVKSELNRFILEHTGVDALSSVDEIVLSYIIGVLENIGSSNLCEEAFDVTEFTEVMSAYIPPFSNINSSHVFDWMLKFAEWLKKIIKDHEKSKDIENITLGNHNLITESESTYNLITKSNCAPHSRRKSYSSRSCSSSQSDDEEKCINVSECNMSTEIEMLLEMFPNLHVMEAKQFFCMADRNCEKAVQLILQKQEIEEDIHDSLITKSLVKQNTGHSKEKLTTDKKLKDQILQRYAYIDQVDDVREHKPVAPKTEPKKLIRYRDNKIVSIKGEKYSEVKRDVADDVKDKIVIKPAKKYRL